MSTHEPGVPLVSVVVIFLNEARFLEEAIESVLAQTFDDWELCLVDDGSTDRSSLIARAYAARYPGRIRVVTHPDGGNHGMSASRNLGLAMTRGRLVAFLDGDDTLLPEKLQRQVAELESEPRAAMVVGQTINWYSWASSPAAQDYCPAPGVETDALASPPSLLRRLFADIAWAPAICAALFRREALERVDGFANEFRDMYEDQVVWVKLFSSESVLLSSGALERYRQHNASTCVQAARDLPYHPWYPNAVRGAFLAWAQAYLQACGHGDSWTMERLAMEMRPMRHPTAPAEITAVTLSGRIPKGLRGYSVDCPRPGDLTGGERVRIFGWVLGARSPAVAVEALSAAAVVARAPVEGLRPDLEPVFPDDEAASHAGYHLTVPIVGVTPLEVSLRAVLADGTTAPLAVIRARRAGPTTSPPDAPIVGAAPQSTTAHGARPSERRAAILLYHRVAATPGPDPWRLAVTPNAFATHLELLRADFEPIPLEALARAAGDGALPRRAVAVTFDDGYADNLLTAKPLLEAYDVPATFFLISGTIGGKGFWWDELLDIVLDEDSAHGVGDKLTGAGEARYRALWENLSRRSAAERTEELRRMTNGRHARLPNVLTEGQARALLAGGLVDIGAHTVSHPKLPLLSGDDQEIEIRESRDQLQAMLDRPIRMFSYPHGEYSPETRRLARATGFVCAFGSEPAPVFAGSDPFELPRLPVTAQSGEELERQLGILFDG